MTERDVSTTRIDGDGRRMRSATRLEMGEEMIRRSHLEEVEEEEAKEMEERGHRHRHLEEEGGGGDQPRGHRRQVGIIDGDQTSATIVESDVLSALAEHFEKPSLPPPPPIPVFKDSYKEYPRFPKDFQSYLKEFYSTAPEWVKVMTICEKCFTKATLAKIGHLDSVKEILAALSETYVCTDGYIEEILVLIQKMHPLENDHVGLESFFVHILVLCTESWALNMYHHVANPLITLIFIDQFPLNEIRDWDSYRNGEGLCYPNEFCMMEQFCRDRLPGVRRLADRQKTRAAAEPQQQHRQNLNLNYGQRDFHRDRGHGSNFERDKKRELYQVTSAAANVVQAGQQVSPPKV